MTVRLLDGEGGPGFTSLSYSDSEIAVAVLTLYRVNFPSRISCLKKLVLKPVSELAFRIDTLSAMTMGVLCPSYLVYAVTWWTGLGEMFKLGEANAGSAVDFVPL